LENHAVTDTTVVKNDQQINVGSKQHSAISYVSKVGSFTVHRNVLDFVKASSFPHIAYSLHQLGLGMAHLAFRLKLRPGRASLLSRGARLPI
jgi:hypothetical protein